jgi:hypothetical protein
MSDADEGGGEGDDDRVEELQAEQPAVGLAGDAQGAADDAAQVLEGGLGGDREDARLEVGGAGEGERDDPQQRVEGEGDGEISSEVRADRLEQGDAAAPGWLDRTPPHGRLRSQQRAEVGGDAGAEQQQRKMRTA